MFESIIYKNNKIKWGIRVLAYFFVAFSLLAALIILGAFIVSKFTSKIEPVMILQCFTIIVSSVIVVKIFEKSNILDRFGLKNNKIFSKYVLGYSLGTLFIILSALPIILFFSSSFELNNNIKYSSIVFYFLFFIIQGASEEVLVRGLIFPIIAKESRPIYALLITSSFFAILHLLNPGVTTTSVVNLFLAGMMFGYCVLLFDSLWQACALHSAWNFVQGSILGFNVSGTSSSSIFKIVPSGSDIFTGGEFGVEGSIFSVIVLLTVVIIMHVICIKKGKKIFSKKSVI